MSDYTLSLIGSHTNLINAARKLKTARRAIERALRANESSPAEAAYAAQDALAKLNRAAEYARAAAASLEGRAAAPPVAGDVGPDAGDV